MKPFGELLREWRERRGVSQLALACEAEVSSRHVSFLETGRAAPSREMVLRLSRVLSVPLRERNVWLHAAGFAHAFAERSLDDRALSRARAAVELVLRGHEPFPALAVDRHWTLVASNDAVTRLLAGVAPKLLEPPVNVLRLSLHPEGLGPRIQNFEQWRTHLVERLHRQIETLADPVLVELAKELQRYPTPTSQRDRAGQTPSQPEYGGVAIPLELATDAGVLRLISTTTVFGTAVDVTLSELVLESFFPADARTAELLAPPSSTRRGRVGRAVPRGSAE
ncbi:MAG TPA: helix-turn-helix transcriptional regulator [Polyangiaceae bacterium]|nr:helix-turn-helix transcriptional regulator [Polyangiaceae bacterium]